MSKKTRRAFPAKQKAEILRKHLKDKMPVSDVCDEHNLQPSVFYGWQTKLLDNAETVLGSEANSRKRRSQEQRFQSKVEALEAKLAEKDNVIAEIMAVGLARYPRSDRRLRGTVVREDRATSCSIYKLVAGSEGQVLRLA